MAEMTVKTITKNYSRKVNLRYISSRYDNVEFGGLVAASVEYDTEEELSEFKRKLSNDLREDIEKDIKDSIDSLIARKEDPDQYYLLGLDKDGGTEDVPPMTKKIKENKKTSDIKEEVLEVSDDDVLSSLGIEGDGSLYNVKIKTKIEPEPEPEPEPEKEKEKEKEKDLEEVDLDEFNFESFLDE